MRLAIVPVGEVPEVVLHEVKSILETRFEATVGVQEPVDLPEGSRDGPPAQVESTEMVELAKSVGAGDKNLVLTGTDLAFENRDYVFGLAEFDGSGAAVSYNRFTQASANGQSIDAETAKARLRKEVVHEVGHLIGHRHCGNDKCVMSFSIDVDHIDRKRDEFCRSCRERDLPVPERPIERSFLE